MTLHPIPSEFPYISGNFNVQLIISESKLANLWFCVPLYIYIMEMGGGRGGERAEL
jgi:hypothetical protein